MRMTIGRSDNNKLVFFGFKASVNVDSNSAAL